MSPGCYKFSRYKTGKLDSNNNSGSDSSSSTAVKEGSTQAEASSSTTAGSDESKPLLVAPTGADTKAVVAMAEAFYWVS